MTDEQLEELAPWSEKLQSIKNRMWIIVNYSNSQRAGVILYLTALIFGAYDIAEGKGVHREVESEGSRMWEQTNHGQISGLTDRNHI